MRRRSDMPLLLRLPIIGPFLLRRMEIVANTDPGKITIGEVAEMFCFPRWLAFRLCEMGVYDGTFDRYWSVVDWRVEPVYALRDDAPEQGIPFWT